jgi:RecB family exonuclease
VDRRFGELEYDAGWVEHYERGLARGMVAALGDYTRDRLREGYEALGVETPFTIEHEGIVLRGVIDRLEKTPEGRVLVVDLKTGTPQTDAAVVDNPQMLAYQMALESPGIQQVLGDTAPVSAGARAPDRPEARSLSGAR